MSSEKQGSEEAAMESRTPEQIMRDCNHPEKERRDCEVKTQAGETVHACWRCGNAAKARWQELRKAELAARPKDCARCGQRPHTFVVAGYRLCGRCKTATMREHHAEAARHGALAIFATSLLVDTAGWAYRAKEGR